MQINYVLVNIIIAMKRTCAFYICQNTQNHNETSNFACGKFKLLSKNVSADNRKTMMGRVKPICGLVIGIIAMAAVMSLANAFVLTPIYAVTAVPNLPAINSYSALLSFTEKVYLGQLLHLPSMSTYIFSIIMPFNLLKGLINAVAVYLLFEATLKTIKPFVRKRFNLN